MEKSKLGIMLIALAALALTTAVVSAAPIFNAQRGQIGANDTKDYEAVASITGYGGNITTFNFSIERSTFNWVGFWGQVTNGLVLEGAGNASFYDWGNQDSTGWVFFAETNGIDWTNIASSVQGDREAEDTALGLTGKADSVNSTFTSINSADIEIGSITVNAGSSVSANTSSNGGTEWETVLIVDGGDAIYAGPIQQGNENYEGSAADFQVMVPINLATGNRAYYLYAAVD